MTKWIDCAQQMPPAYRDVLALVDNIAMQVAWLPRWQRWEFLSDNYEILRNPFRFPPPNPTHWMELPNLPGKE